MTVKLPEKLPLTSMDVAAEKRDELRHLLAATFPEAVSEGKIDLDQLKRALGEWSEPDRERFGLNWPGKAACMKVIQAPSVGTLKPSPENSVDWETTQNLFIEGDNLEVLKLLQKAYFSQIKMIYIDPPYNTGKEFIYPDKYAETLDTYLEYTGQKDTEGRKFSTNTDSAGRFHSRWLNMMYPRLYLAKNLLKSEGAIFVSINDNEAANLRRVMDDIYGEENFIAQVVWQRSKKGDAKTISNNHEYVLVYAKDKTETIAKCRWKKPKEGADSVLAYYQELRTALGNDHAAIRQGMMEWYRGLPKDDVRRAHKHYSWSDDRGLYFPDNFAGPDDGRTSRPRHEILHPVTGKSCKKPSTGWRWDEDKTKWALAQTPPRIHFGADETTIPNRKSYLFEIDAETFPSVFYADGRSATLEVEGLVGAGVFPFPKNVEVLEDFMSLICDDGDIVLDFFAGSASTGHAVFNQSLKGRKLRFILIQLPEPCDDDSTAAAAGYKTIADIGRARLRNAQAKLASTRPQADGTTGLGFRQFSLEPSCFKQWNPGGQGETDQSLLDRIEAHSSNLSASDSAEDILFELLLKDGFPLAVGVERRSVAGAEVVSVADGALIICLSKDLTQEVVDGIAGLEPSRVICLDAGFKGNDQLKANAVQTFKSRARSRETAIEFRTV